MTAPWTRVVLGAAIPVALVITGLVTVLAHGKLSTILVRGPLPVLVVKPDTKRRKKWGEPDEWSEPELLKDSPWSGLNASHDNEPPPPRYIHQDMIWDEWQEEFVEYKAKPPPEVPPDDDLLYWFKVYSRRRTGHKDEKPTITVEVLSQTLINFLRSLLGSSSTFNSRPEVDIHQLFSHQDAFKDWLQKLEPSFIQTLDIETKEKMAADLGVPDIQNDGMTEEILSQFFESARKQLHELVVCLQKEFEPIQKELAAYLAHGRITHDLLGYTLKPGAKLIFVDNRGDKFAVRMTSSQYQKGSHWFTVEGQGYAWDGTKYLTVHHKRSVNIWQGTQSLASLPWRVLTPEDELELTSRGRIYCQYSGTFHVFNNGPLGGRGRAMVDSRSRGKHDNPESNKKRWDHPVEEDEPPSSDEDQGEELDHTLLEENICFLPPTVEGFMLREKEWVTMRILALTPPEFDHHAWDHLVLDPDVKRLIRSLVDVTCSRTTEALVSDVIAGKGGGLVAVLHGKPGTGKTLTAEAIAEHLERPLYIVGAEELPGDAVRMEESLKKILNRSTRWNAVLLIDEADVFLEQRSLHELDRNAVVSVALRLLEYHTGVLFLTTNRINAFDEAFLSRFSIGIRYPELNKTSRLKIWRSFLHMAEMDIVQDRMDLVAADLKARIHIEDLEQLAEKSFNGRTIKNLVRTSQALALANKEPLGIKHLDIVAKTSERFLQDFKDFNGQVNRETLCVADK